MTDTQVIHVEGELVAEVAVSGGRMGPWYSDRLLLFRHCDLASNHRTWTLLDVGHGAGQASVVRITARDLDEIKGYLNDDLHAADHWSALVHAGAPADPDLMTLWVPVQIDADLQKATLYRRALRVRPDVRRPANWRTIALSEAVERLWDLHFVVLESSTDIRQVFPNGPPFWADGDDSLVGAMVAAKYDYRADLVVAVDGAGEIYIRTAEPNPVPGDPRRHAARPLTRRERRKVEEAYRQRDEPPGPVVVVSRDWPEGSR